MDLQTFRQIVDQTPARIMSCENEPARLYAYVGLTLQNTYQLNTVQDALNDRIRNAFAHGDLEAWRTCRDLKSDLIRAHVILGVPLNPYFEVLSHLCDALRARTGGISDAYDDWLVAVQAAADHIEISSWRTTDHKRIYAREYAVAEAAKFLVQQGYHVRLEPGVITLDEQAEASLVAKIEDIIAKMGGLNVARQIFAEISSSYDSDLQRYQIVQRTSQTGGGHPQIPWGYLLQLSVKHVDGEKPYLNLKAHWPQLISLATAYAAVIDVQPYAPLVWARFDAKGLLKFLQERALYDSIFRFLQLRASDVLKLCRGAFSFLNWSDPTPAGWTLDEAFEVVGYLVDPIRDVRGPIIITEADVRRALPKIPRNHIVTILKEVFAHPVNGANQQFSRPTDAPTPADKSKGADFYLKPLIRRPGNRYLIVERAACGWGYLEALLTALRPAHNQLDDKVGTAIEDFLAAELASHGVSVASGDYDICGKHGECDIVAETPETLFFMELKKKSLTRRAKAGSDADLLLDLAGSLIAAQAQAGWHELRISNYGALDLSKNGKVHHLSLNGRGIEKIAIGMLDFGSFQDRVLLEQFLEATLNANFSSPDASYAKRFQPINSALQDIRDQYTASHQGKTEVHAPFFNCWFISVPQLLVFLDVVGDANSFRTELWSCRHIITGTSDLYFEISHMRRMKAAAAQSVVN